MLFLFFWKLASCNLKSAKLLSWLCMLKGETTVWQTNYIITYTTTSTIWRVIYPEEQKLIRFLFICQESSIWFDLKLRKSPRLRNIVFFFFKSSSYHWYYVSNTDISRTFELGVMAIRGDYPTNLPWWCCYVLSPVHRELSSDYLEASKIKQCCLCGSLSSLASVARKPHSNDFFS